MFTKIIQTIFEVLNQLQFVKRLRINKNYKYILFISLFFFAGNFKIARAIDDDAPVAIDSRIKTFIYSENDIYTLKFRLGYNSIIEFGEDESIETISLGDPYPWKITPIERRLFMKPIEPGVATNMTLITNKRMYLFEIQSDIATRVDSPDVIHLVRFFYPSVRIDRLDNAGNIKSSSRVKDILYQKGTNDSAGSINILYSFAGKANRSSPIEIFDDKRKTYLRFNKDMDYKKLKIFSPKSKIGKVKLDFRKTGDFIVLDGVFIKIIIEYGGSKTEIYNDILAI
jgi:type IV secretion system protein VirB9